MPWLVLIALWMPACFASTPHRGVDYAAPCEHVPPYSGVACDTQSAPSPRLQYDYADSVWLSRFLTAGWYRDNYLLRIWQSKETKGGTDGKRHAPYQKTHRGQQPKVHRTPDSGHHPHVDPKHGGPAP